MRAVARTAFLGLALAASAPLILAGWATPDSARVETRLQLADLLYGDQRYWEAMAGTTAPRRARATISCYALRRAYSGHCCMLPSSLVRIRKLSS